MSLVIDTLRTSPVTEELSEAEVEILAELFEVQEYKAGDVIVEPKDDQPDNLYILASGDIDVKIESNGEQSTIHILKPGDLAGMITFAGGAASHVSATLYAVGDTKVVSMSRARFETLINSHPMIVYRVMRGIIRNMHGIVRRVNSESAELSNYIYRTGGRY
ncbi:MAG: Crp/Fnr family transcriptional regulator [Gallionellales bacterium CG_4_10_14_3_um_filter_54_96]|nr:cyclic nucleotide-binding domain-containing protein [Gallionella sp.]OIO74133.1 MAG: Crp/Fnr family transcriptional regulator [Gallionellaceae bacterium CG1_02_56_997]PIV14300.1 MAG: Crp/Fnr family transcriptional regulator [Gallionellales bacterium CG03_land_8_20_14_0_80_55_15]PIV91778.1 MAG: Crp/Fnr family transcriptional regulator [Gallionellales bacterium CG17_big_fil_post_rev_8_21_14_2_50_54_146]PIY06019.1 MAG: Crp/Fnr family transcriptional regulator [Gallionellales bacterium CG_4_10_1